MSEKKGIAITVLCTDGSVEYSKDSAVLLEEYCRANDGKTMIVQPGGASKTTAWLNFFHGPLIDAFVRATGETNREFWKEYLKREFLMEHIQSEKFGIIRKVKSLAELTQAESWEFADKCIALLQDQHYGYLTPRERYDYLHMKDEDEALKK